MESFKDILGDSMYDSYISIDTLEEYCYSYKDFLTYIYNNMPLKKEIEKQVVNFMSTFIESKDELKIEYIKESVECFELFLKNKYSEVKFIQTKFIFRNIINLLYKEVDVILINKLKEIDNNKELLNNLLKKEKLDLILEKEHEIEEKEKKRLEYIKFFEDKKKSLLDSILVDKNIYLIDAYVEEGIELESIMNENLYIYILNKSKKEDNTNKILEKFCSIGIKIPEKIWILTFKKMIEGYKNIDYFYNIKEKNFIIDSENEKSVWNIIIDNQSYDLIKLLPEEFFIKHSCKGQTIIEYYIESEYCKGTKNDKNLIFFNNLGRNLFKIADSEDDLFKLYKYYINKDIFINKFLGVIKNLFINDVDKEFDEVRDIINNRLRLLNENNIYKLYKEITNHTQNNLEVFISSLSLNTLHVFYKNKELPSHLIKQITEYLNSIDYILGIDATIQPVSIKNNFNRDIELCKRLLINEDELKIGKFFESSFEKFYKTLNKKEIKGLILQVTKIYKNLNNISKKNVENEDFEENQDNIMIELVSDEAIENFNTKYKDSKNDVLSDFIKNMDKKISPVRKKKMALASKLLESIDILNETFPHFEEVIEHLRNIMILQEKGDKSFYIPPLLLGGGPGVGKTFFCHTVSKLVETHFEMISMESMTANFVLTGLSNNWSGADTGLIFKVLFNENIKTINPIFLLDEIEKAGGDSRHSVINSLLPLLERYTAKKFKDECIPLEINASNIIWLATANNTNILSAPIKSRFDIMNVPNPNPKQRKSLIKGIYKSVRENNSWGHIFDEVIPEESLDLLSMLMSPGAARDLRKTITLACSKAVRDNKTMILPNHIDGVENINVLPWNQVVF